ncbi:MAG TPA: hypothetical protein VHI73_07225 [Solirubrobacteraceae bacterium]|nr:hypothetical protein [Solirubrobacteraceae bacterium]
MPAQPTDRSGSAEPERDERCRPCRGTGSVISRLGGEPKAVVCPWCGGTGLMQSGADAQARRREAGDR